jgi:hypothetical protein
MSRPLYIIMEERDLTKNPFVILRYDSKKFSYVYLAETTSWLRARRVMAVPSSIKKNKLAAKKQEREVRGAKKMKAKAIRAERKLKEQSRV